MDLPEQKYMQQDKFRDRSTHIEDDADVRVPLRVGIAGLGSIGLSLVDHFKSGVEGLRLVAVSTRHLELAREIASTAGPGVTAVCASSLADYADVIIDCAPAAAFKSIAAPALASGCTVITVNGTALLENPEILQDAGANGGRLILATGALLGFDAVRAAAKGIIHSVRLVTRKPPRSLKGAPHVVNAGIDLDRLDRATLIFSGNAIEGAQAFPANVNVAAALALAGVGPQLTQIEVWADPKLERNTHFIEVDSDSAHFSMSIENIPSQRNSATGRITAQSVMATVDDLVSPVRIGT